MEADKPAGQETALFPWHLPVWETLMRDVERLPHGLLLRGRPGLGKRAFAGRLAQALLCASPDGNGAACGQCKSCLLFAAGNHPDLSVVAPLEDSKYVTVDQVRGLMEFLSLRPHTAVRKVVVLAPAEAMNLNAANSLLKVLEEPPLGSFLVLVTGQPGRLPATIRSRCTQVAFALPPRAEALAWLRARPDVAGDHELLLDLAGGSPLLAEEYARGGFLAQRAQLLDDILRMREQRESPLTCAARWKGIGTLPALSWFHGFTADLVRMAVAGAGARLANPDLRQRLQVLGKDLNLNRLYIFLDVVSDSISQLSGPLDELLVLEDILIRWNRLTRQPSTL